MSKKTFLYRHQEVEPHWQKEWENQALFQDQIAHFVQKLARGEKLDPLYLLFAFAYPSGSGLHVGHVESKTALDILARYYRMQGKDVFFPVGWDAFGLPAENYAIKTGVPPVTTTKQAIDTFRRQIKRLAISYDWAAEIATCHPEYYKFTQWLFAQLYQHQLAYKKMGVVNWCPSCQTVLANEQVVEGRCERCDNQVIQKELEQWYFRITQYQDELIAGLEQLDWPAATKQQQLHWIGKSEGVSIDFHVEGFPSPLTVWTKYWETVFGTTFVVIAPELFTKYKLKKLVDPKLQISVQAYLEAASKKTEEERKIGEKDKTGVNTGLMVTNPVNGDRVPLYIADYVLPHVGTGVVMGVPAHDERDFLFAQKHSLPVLQVVSYPHLPAIDAKVKAGQRAYSDEGVLVNSAQFNGLDAWGEGKTKMADWMIGQGFARRQTTYRLRDWLISRQRYWGAPIPVIYDPEGEPHLIKDEDLPWLLPTDVDFKPTGESPLVSSGELQERTQNYAQKEFAQLIEQKGWRSDATDWRPEYDTMDTFVDSSWYYLRYLDARNQQEFAKKDRLKQFMPVDFYLIGPEHIVLHLLYSRFFTKFLRDQGYLDLPSGEPFAKMRHQGMILGPDHRKMSKSKGNVINPDLIINQYGADTLRVYEMFMGPLEADKPWDDRAVQGVFRFLNKIYELVMSELEYASVDANKTNETDDANKANKANDNHISLTFRRKLHATIKKVTQDLPALKFNTAIASLMELVNVWKEQKALISNENHSLCNQEELLRLIKILAPLAPFLAEELWHQAGQTQTIHCQTWPTYDHKLAQPEQIILPVQVNGKIRGELKLDQEELQQMTKEQVLARAKQLDSVMPWLKAADRGFVTLTKEIYVPNKIVSLAW